MFTFLLRFYDENPTIYLIVCSLTLQLCIYCMYVEFFTSSACDQHRLDENLVGQQKNDTQTNSDDFVCKGIEWIKSKFEYYMHITIFTLIQKKKSSLSSNLIFCLRSVPRMQQIFHKYCNKFGEIFRYQHTIDMDRFFQ